MATIKIVFYNERVFPEMVSQIGPKVMIYNQDTVYIIGLNFCSGLLVWLETVGSHRIPTSSSQLSMSQQQIFRDLARKCNSDEIDD